MLRLETVDIEKSLIDVLHGFSQTNKRSNVRETINKLK